METLLRLIKKIVPKKIFRAVQPAYHYTMAFLGALAYRFPARQIKVVAVTGTKGKSSVVELVGAILDTAGFKTALASTIHFKIAGVEEKNLFKMTMPGRFFMQKLLRRAVNARCEWAVVEMTSEGARQFRHKFIPLDALIFTNLAPEHIESHGSYEKYVAAKVSLARALQKSRKSNHPSLPSFSKEGKMNRKVLVVNGDDKEAEKFLAVFSDGEKILYGRKDAPASESAAGAFGVSFNFAGLRITSPLPGEFNLYNMLAAASFARAIGIVPEIIKRGIESVSLIRGRAEFVREGQNFDVVVDYAHTPDSLTALYKTFAGKKIIAVLGNTGGGRDTWKRPEMGRIADEYCDEIILTNEDPYDEDPQKIMEEMAGGIKNHRPKIILDRREAIAAALRSAAAGSVVLITGKGTDPYIMEANGKKTPWNDATVVREVLGELLGRQNV